MSLYESIVNSRRRKRDDFMKGFAKWSQLADMLNGVEEPMINKKAIQGVEKSDREQLAHIAAHAKFQEDLVRNFESTQKYREAMENQMTPVTQRIIALAILIFALGAVATMLMIPAELRGGIYKRMEQESQTHAYMITAFNHDLGEKISKEHEQTKGIDERLSEIEKYIKHKDGDRFMRFILEERKRGKEKAR